MTATTNTDPTGGTMLDDLTVRALDALARLNLMLATPATYDEAFDALVGPALRCEVGHRTVNGYRHPHCRGCLV